MNNNEKTWWFENQYGKTYITINDQQITMNHKGLTTFSLKKSVIILFLLVILKP
ncbi:hypothetical protein [Spiroplasma endosymbiont of Nebria brevicollis]|uniref:hypothetical protein n=1 Tax=Spiroplasma endosymbiont of Nebria brevicollis TaxID=3066284 RepID=UPI00313E27AB